MTADKLLPISIKKLIRLNHGPCVIVVHYAEMLTGDSFEFRHMHPYNEIFYVNYGSLNVMVENELIEMTEGNLLFVSKDTPHHVLLNPGTENVYFVIVFELQFDVQHTSNQIDENIDKSKFYSGKWDAHEILENMHYELKTEKFGGNMIVNMLCNIFIIQALRLLVLEADEIVYNTPERRNFAIEVTDYIQKHYMDDISFEGLAAHLYISPRHLKRIIKKMYNTTFSETLNILRVAHAKTLIETTNLTIDEIAQKVGIGSEQSLRKNFKKYEGITISHHKKKTD